VRSTCSRAANASRSSGLVRSAGRQVPRFAMPGFPGAIRSVETSGSRPRRQARACSRPPAPTIRIFTGWFY